MELNSYDLSGFDGDSRSAILMFLRFYKEFMGNLIESGKDPKGKMLFAYELYPLVVSAWKEMPEHFLHAEKACEEISEERLFSYGLYGNQLKLKLSVIARLKEKYRKNGGKSLLMLLLDGIDNLLGSILGAAGLGDALAEVKDAVKGSIE